VGGGAPGGIPGRGALRLKRERIPLFYRGKREKKEPRVRADEKEGGVPGEKKSTGKRKASLSRGRDRGGGGGKDKGPSFSILSPTREGGEEENGKGECSFKEKSGSRNRREKRETFLPSTKVETVLKKKLTSRRRRESSRCVKKCRGDETSPSRKGCIVQRGGKGIREKKKEGSPLDEREEEYSSPKEGGR